MNKERIADRLTDYEVLLTTLQARFEHNMSRHKGIEWQDVKKRLTIAPEKLRALSSMEATGGEPDVVVLAEGAAGYTFVDCSPESPQGRRSLCYDVAAWEARKANRPSGSAMGMASDMSIELLTEEQYRALQERGEFDTKTSSWVKTPERIRKLGGALFCDRRYDTVFVYHNGAESYYGARGFRGILKV